MIRTSNAVENCAGLEAGTSRCRIGPRRKAPPTIGITAPMCCARCRRRTHVRS
ncbi:MAG: hypothetical protein QOI01_7366 [Mycobacterium sp.]|nr:hypothetical protein [Mycobacterium sp.]